MLQSDKTSTMEASSITIKEKFPFVLHSHSLEMEFCWTINDLGSHLGTWIV